MSETPQETMQIRIDVTDKAVQELTKALDGRDLSTVGLKISVHPGGCSGFQYGLSFEEAPATSDVELNSKGVRLFLEANTAPLLDGIAIDYIDSLMGGGFKIHNPNATSTCGCGKSFS